MPETVTSVPNTDAIVFKQVGNVPGQDSIVTERDSIVPKQEASVFKQEGSVPKQEGRVPKFLVFEVDY